MPNRYTYENIATNLEVYLEWIFMYDDRPLSKIAELHTQDMMDMLDRIGERVREGEINIRVFVEPGPGPMNHMPWGKSTREKRNARIVKLRGEGWEFSQIAREIDMSISGVKYAYGKGVGK